jgi:transposase
VVRVELTPAVRAELERRVRAETSTKRDARRARIVLACAELGSSARAAESAGVAESTARRWRERFLARGLEGLADAPRSGHPPRFTPVQRLEIIATACDPAPRENGLNGWTMDRLRDELVRREIVPPIRRSSVHRILEQVDLKPHRIDGWVHSPDPEFRAKATEICELYLHPPEGSVVVRVDEKTGMHAIEQKYPEKPAAPGRAGRREFEYVRHGTPSWIAAFAIHDGEVLAHGGDTRTGDDLERFMDPLAWKYPDVQIHVIWDNRNIQTGERWVQFNERHGGRFVFHDTPQHASWVNPIELFFGIVERKSLRHGNFRSTAELREAVLAFIAYWNERLRHPFRWTFRGYPLQTGLRLEEAG